MKHASALSAFVNPSVNSYRRLVEGYEAPVKITFVVANRTALVRIPAYTRTPSQKRIEYRSPDATCNIYYALPAMLLAGFDGIENKIDSVKEGFGSYEMDVSKFVEESGKISSLPVSLEQVLESLRHDYEFLTRGDVFDKELIDTWIQHKYESEVHPFRKRVHPYEFQLSYNA